MPDQICCCLPYEWKTGMKHAEITVASTEKFNNIKMFVQLDMWHKVLSLYIQSSCSVKESLFHLHEGRTKPHIRDDFWWLDPLRQYVGAGTLFYMAFWSNRKWFSSNLPAESNNNTNNKRRYKWQHNTTNKCQLDTTLLSFPSSSTSSSSMNGGLSKKHEPRVLLIPQCLLVGLVVVASKTHFAKNYEKLMTCFLIRSYALSTLLYTDHSNMLHYQLEDAWKVCWVWLYIGPLQKCVLTFWSNIVIQCGTVASFRFSTRIGIS